MLLLLEGKTLKLPAPQNLFTEDIIICTDQAIFATCKAAIVYQGPDKKTNLQDDAMMRVPWKTFNFTHQFSEENQKQVNPCGRCFAELVHKNIH